MASLAEVLYGKRGTTLKRVLVVAVIVLAGVGVGMAAASYFRAAEDDAPIRVYDAESAREGTRARTTDAFIASLQERVTKNPNDAQGNEFLGVAYLQKARETGDPGYYDKAETLLERALELEPKNFGAMTALGSLALSRHQFHEALDWGMRARAIAPFLPHNYGVIGDAQIELGMYEEAVKTIQTMVDQRPDLASFARVSYLRELHGDKDGAIRAMQQAVDAGGANAENTNWARVQLGNLYFNRGQLDEAESKYREALANYPDYHYALAALGRVSAARGDFEAAVELYLKAIEIIPLPQYAIELGDLSTVMGRENDAERLYDLVRFEQELYRANGVDVDAELALFAADHKQNLDDAVARARAVYAKRPSIQVADVLAWTLYRNGKYKEAEMYSKDALRLGTRDALMEYHAAMIAYQLGKYDTAQKLLSGALELNPHFSIRYAGGAGKLLDAMKAGEHPKIQNNE